MRIRSAMRSVLFSKDAASFITGDTVIAQREVGGLDDKLTELRPGCWHEHSAAMQLLALSRMT